MLFAGNNQADDVNGSLVKCLGTYKYKS